MTGDALQLPPQELAARVSRLPTERFLEVYRLYEKLGRQTDVMPEMSVLRDRLVRLRPRRAPTFTRLLCMPFEDFIVRETGGTSAPISRRQCRTLGRLVTRLMGPTEVATVQRQLAAIDPVAGDDHALVDVGGRIWSRAAALLRSTRFRRRRGRSTGADSLRESLALIIRCLESGRIMVTLGSGLPRGPLQDLDRRGKALLSRTIRSVPEDGLSRLRLPMMLLMGRLESPARAVSILQDSELAISPATRRALLHMTADMLTADMAQCRIALENYLGRHERAPLPELMARIEPAVRKARDGTGAGVGHEAMTALLAVSAAAIRERVLKSIPGRLKNTLALLTAPYVDDAAGDPDRVRAGQQRRIEDMMAMEHALRAVVAAGHDADMLGIQSEVRAAVAQASAALEQACQGLVSSAAISSGPATADPRGCMMILVHLIEIVAGSDRADRIRIDCETVLERAGQHAA